MPLEEYLDGTSMCMIVPYTAPAQRTIGLKRGDMRLSRTVLRSFSLSPLQPLRQFPVISQRSVRIRLDMVIRTATENKISIPTSPDETQKTHSTCSLLIAYACSSSIEFHTLYMPQLYPWLLASPTMWLDPISHTIRPEEGRSLIFST